MSFKKFEQYCAARKKATGVKKEYLDEKGNLVEKPKVKVVADYDGPTPASPEAPEKGAKPAPYKAANKEVAPQKGEKGFADLGDKNLVYEPSVKGGSSKHMPLGTELGSDWPKETKTEQFLDRTKDMNVAEFTRYMLEHEIANVETDNLPHVNAYASGPFHPYPPEAIKYVVTLANKNEKMLKDLVHEMKRSGCMNKLMSAIFEHPESYTNLSDLFGDETDGPKRSRSFTKAMADSLKKFMDDHKSAFEESVGPPRGLDGLEDEEHPDSEVGENGFEDEEDLSSHPEDEEGNEEEEEGDEEAPEEEDEEGGPDMEDDAGFDDMGSEDEMGGEDMPSPPPKKLKKRFAHHHMLDAMAGHEDMMNAMKAYMKA